MSDIDPRTLCGVGFALMLVGFILPALMIMKILDSTFLLNFLAYGASFIGLMFGLLGVLMIAIRRRHG